MNLYTARKLQAAGATVSALDEDARIIGTQLMDGQVWIHVAYIDDIAPNQWLPAKQVREF